MACQPHRVSEGKLSHMQGPAQAAVICCWRDKDGGERSITCMSASKYTFLQPCLTQYHDCGHAMPCLLLHAISSTSALLASASLQDNIQLNTSIADLIAARDLWMANAAHRVLHDRHGLADAVCSDSQGFSPAHIHSGSRSRSGSSNASTDSDVGSSTVDDPAGLAASVGLATLSAVYITGSGLFTAGPTNGASSSNSSAPTMVSAAGMTAAAAFAVTLGLVPPCKCITVLAACHINTLLLAFCGHLLAHRAT